MEPRFSACCCRSHRFLPRIHTFSSPASTPSPPLPAAAMSARSPIPPLVDVVNLLVEHLGALLVDALEITEEEAQGRVSGWVGGGQHLEGRTPDRCP